MLWNIFHETHLIQFKLEEVMFEMLRDLCESNPVLKTSWCRKTTWADTQLNLVWKDTKVGFHGPIQCLPKFEFESTVSSTYISVWWWSEGFGQEARKIFSSIAKTFLLWENVKRGLNFTKIKLSKRSLWIWKLWETEISFQLSVFQIQMDGKDRREVNPILMSLSIILLV